MPLSEKTRWVTSNWEEEYSKEASSENKILATPASLTQNFYLGNYNMTTLFLKRKLKCLIERFVVIVSSSHYYSHHNAIVIIQDDKSDFNFHLTEAANSISKARRVTEQLAMRADGTMRSGRADPK